VVRPAKLLRKTRRLRREAAELAARPPVPPPRPARSFADWCGDVLPHYFNTPPADFHGPLFARLDRMHERRGTRDAVIAPRNGAKSTIETLAYPLRCALEGWEPYTLILSDSTPQANELLGHIRRELETNPALADRYPHAAGVGPVWRVNRLQLRNGAVLEALGRGSRVRGRRSRQHRPSLVILDDVQSNRDVISPTLRRTAWDWVTREVVPAGDAGTNFLSVGSALHSEAVAVRVGNLPGWTASTYKAVHEWPDRLDLWGEWERLATNVADPARKETAAAFYAANRGEMDRGARVYWDAKWPLAELMLKRAEIGPAAFDGEYQGVPNLGGRSVWPAEYWDDAPGKPFWFDRWPADLVCKVVSLDPSGGGVAGDYQAVGLVGIDRLGDLWLDCDLFRDHPQAMVARTVRHAREWGPFTIVAEQNSTLGLLRAEFEDQIKGKPLPCDVEYVTNTDKKEDRILDAVGKYLTRRRVHVRRTRGGQALAEQGRQWPHADHDDALDAVSVGVRRIEERLLRGR
jgi:hypothetical protein